MISVLYVDDERDLLEIARLFLEKTGDFRVGTSTSAQEALDSLSILSYDAIIADYQMPGMDGIAFLKAVRQRYGDIPFILFTGRGREEVVIEAINNGADFYIQKGGDPKAQFAELSHKIRQAVARRQAERLLIESEKRLSDIINFLPDATFAIDRSGHVIAWNRAIEEMTGVAAPDMVGKWDHEYAIPFYGTRRPVLIDLIFEPDEVIAKKYTHIIHEKDILIAETSLPRPKGKPAILMGKASPLYNRVGDIVGAIESIRDITGLVNAEEGISRARKDWETIFRAIGHPAIVLDTNNQIIDANDAAIRTTGMALGLLIGRHCYEVFHGPGAVCPPEGCPFEKLKRTGSTETSEMESKALNGFYHISCTPVYDAAGRLEKVIHIAMDVTERRRDQDELKAAYEQISASEEELRAQYEELARSEQRIRASEVKFRELAELLPQIVFETDLEFHITYANQYALKATGLTEKDLEAGRTALRYIDPSQHDRIHQNFQKLIRGEPIDNHEYTAVRNDGTVFPVLIYTAPIFHDGHPAGIRGIMVDITDRKLAEDALRESEDRYRKLVEISPDAIILHRDGKIAYMNPAALTLIGASHPDEVIGKNLLDYIHPDSVDAVKTNIQKDLAGDRTSLMELPMLRLDGTSIIVEGRGVRTFIDGNPAVQVAIRDITERKRAEEAIRQANRKLNLLNSITRHDVANQLTLLQGFAQIAAMKNPDPVVGDFLSKIDATAHTIARQIEFTKTYQNLGIHTPAWFRLDETIAKERREEVIFSNTCSHTEVFADPMLERVFFNIFENAIQHGKRVTEITVRCERAPDGLVVIIEDDGVGIPPEEKEKIFDKGYGKNTGFGLFLTKEILSITGITIRETGYMGIGARFEITVPKGAYRFMPVNNPQDQG